MKKILIITYYWPPKGGVGVQRWLKLSKYLYKENYDITIYTTKDGVGTLEDRSLEESIPSGLNILKHTIFEPQKYFKSFFKKRFASDFLLKKETGLLNKLMLWLRANLFIPDSRCFWINPSISFLDNYLRKNPVDVIISSGPPHSMHMIALGLKNKHNFKWIADFRDPWTGIEYFDNLPLLFKAIKKHKKLEKKVFNQADCTLTVSPSWSLDFGKMGAKNNVFLTNGFDPDDYNFSPSKKVFSDFKIGYFGLYNESRDHNFFWQTIKKICKINPHFDKDLKFLFSGEVHQDFFNKIKSYHIHDKLQYYNYLNHQESIANMIQCDMLLVSQGNERAINGRIPAKLFEYIGAKKPILAIGKKGSDLEKIINKISYAWFVEFDNSNLLYNTILEIYSLRNLDAKFSDDISHFSREYQAKKLIKLIEEI